MGYTISKVEVWAGDIFNRPGMLARVLEVLANAGAKLEFIVSRRLTRNTGRVYVAPLTDGKQKRAAADVGLVVASGMHSIRIDGPDRVGLGAGIVRCIAAADINVRGVSAATIGRRSVIYLAFGSKEDAATAVKVIGKHLGRLRRSSKRA